MMPTTTRALPREDAHEPPRGQAGELACSWCRQGFAPRDTGGKPQRFCSERCRRAFDAGGRRWVAAALADGTLTVDELVHPGAAKLPPLADADPDAAAPQPAEAGRLLD